MKRAWTAVFTIMLSAAFNQYILPHINPWSKHLSVLIWMALMFTIGYMLSPSNKKNNRWIGKVIISLCLVFIFGYRTNMIVIPMMSHFFQIIGLNSFFIDLLVIYCGWMFFII